jgi:Fe-S cluster assembly scaffold protein SufB
MFDLNYIAHLRGEKSNVDIEVQGALNDEAKKHFKGTIDFKKGAKKSSGNENEACMLLSNKAKSTSLPMLLCSEDDVEGNHSCSAGKIGEKELFYIMSRGFKLKEALKLMVRAKFNKILENIDDEKLREEILFNIDKKID